jgi:hypothetical protein
MADVEVKVRIRVGPGVVVVAMLCSSLGVGCLWRERRDSGVYVEGRHRDVRREPPREERREPERR